MQKYLKSPWLTSITLAFLTGFYLLDLGNINSMRQGTESLYLGISKEMFNRASFLTPYFNNQITWTKPPLHFWLAFPFHFIFGEATTLSSRLSMVLIGLGFSYYLALWFKKYLKIEPIATFLFFATSIGFFRFSRIYMMEMPLMVFSTLGLLLYFEFSQNKKISYLIFASLASGASCLVKGPVSLVMIFGSIGLYHLFRKIKHQEKIPFATIINFSVLSLFIGSLWFLACYFKYGKEFFEWFFIRENLGKFTSQSYPMRVLIEGLLIYSLPWTFFIGFAVKRFLKDKNSFSEFFLISFSVFFFLWFIPKQRSHHYAIPALALFLSFLWVELHSRFLKFEESSKSFRWIHRSLFTVPLLSFLFTLLCFYVDPKFSLSFGIFNILLCIAGIFLCYKFKDFKLKSLFIFIVFASTLTLFIPQYYFPLIPDSQVEYLKNKKVLLTVGRPFFFNELLEKDNESISFYDIEKRLKEPDTHLIITSDDAELYNAWKHGEIIAHWPKWRRKVSFSQIIFAIKNKNLKWLQEEYYLIRAIDKI